MMKGQNMQRLPGFKAKIASMAVRGTMSIKELAVRWKVNQSQVWVWKERLLQRASLAFQGRDPPGDKPHELEGSRRRQNELWMLNVLLGKISLVQLVKEVAVLPRDHVERLDEINSSEYRAHHSGPRVQLAPLPSRAQFLNVIESVFSGMASAIIHNSDYQSVGQAMAAIDRYFAERNQDFRDNPRRAGGKIWGEELVAAKFNDANNCKNQRYSNSR